MVICLLDNYHAARYSWHTYSSHVDVITLVPWSWDHEWAAPKETILVLQSTSSCTAPFTTTVEIPISILQPDKSSLTAEESSVNQCWVAIAASRAFHRTLANLRPSCGVGFGTGWNIFYVPFVHIIYTGHWCHSFYDCVTFFIVYPKTDGVPVTEIYRPSAHGGRTLEELADTKPTLWRGRIKADILLALRRERGGEWIERRRKILFLFLYFMFF